MGIVEKLQYLKYKRGAVKMGWQYGGVPRANKDDISRNKSAKASQQWEVARVYYEVEKHEDAVKHMT